MFEMLNPELVTFSSSPSLSLMHYAPPYTFTLLTNRSATVTEVDAYVIIILIVLPAASCDSTS